MGDGMRMLRMMMMMLMMRMLLMMMRRVRVLSWVCVFHTSHLEPVRGETSKIVVSFVGVLVKGIMNMGMYRRRSMYMCMVMGRYRKILSLCQAAQGSKAQKGKHPQCSQ